MGSIVSYMNTYDMHTHIDTDTSHAEDFKNGQFTFENELKLADR